MNTGYIIARNRAKKEFFTSSSAYDRPRWITVAEATVYATAELAQAAAIKLAKKGSYEARVVHISEVTIDDLKAASARGDLSMSPGTGPGVELDNIPTPDPQSEEQVDGEKTMTAAVQQDGSSLRAAQTDQEEDASTSAEELENDLDQPNDPSAQSTVTLRVESAPIPARPPLDAPSDDNTTTVADVKLPPTIEYKDPAIVADKPNTDLYNPGALPHTDKIRVPVAVMSDLSSCIGDYEKCAKLSNGVDDAKGSFCMTVVAAFKELDDLLKIGTVESVKQAQIKATSWMSPITVLLPVTVQKFIHMGGRKSTLKDFFDDKKNSKSA